MSLNQNQKDAAYRIAVEITKAYGNCGDPKVSPSVMLRSLYDVIQEIMEDIAKEN